MATLRAFGALLLCALLSACSLNVSKGNYGTGRILVMPTRDVVQAGRPHPVGAGSGKFLQSALVRRFTGTRKFSAVAYESDAEFNHLASIDVRKALTKAARTQADFLLVTSLGEFRDAAPMTFRSDFVSLQEARLIDVHSGKDVWTLMQPFTASGTNIGGYHPLLEELAGKVVSSIAN
jgi:hypothetical protein